MPELSLNKIKPSSLAYPVWEGELWTAKQRQMNRLHYTVSYRASFKPELPDFFIRYFLLTKGITKGVVLDPFGGRGTTILQANLLGFSGIHNDLNPVSLFLARARKNIPSIESLIRRVQSLPLEQRKPLAKECVLSQRDRKRLSPFFHPRTLQEIVNFRSLFLRDTKQEDTELAYIALTLLSRLHGHSDGFLSVYSFPQISILPASQRKNNLRLEQKPEYREVKPRLIRKLKTDLDSPLPETFAKAARKNRYLQNDASSLDSIPSCSVDLVITSPPFLDKVDYRTDNWMRAWFLGVEDQSTKAPLIMTPDIREWCDFMEAAMAEMGRVLKKGSHAVIEVGEVISGSKNKNLEEYLAEKLPLRVFGGTLQVKEILINQQKFTKLSNCWAVTNNRKGTNTNRCLVLQKV